MMIDYTPDLIVFKNENADRVDNLSYIDAPLTKDQMNEVIAAI